MQRSRKTKGSRSRSILSSRARSSVQSTQSSAITNAITQHASHISTSPSRTSSTTTSRVQRSMALLPSSSSQNASVLSRRSVTHSLVSRPATSMSLVNSFSGDSGRPTTIPYMKKRTIHTTPFQPLKTSTLSLHTSSTSQLAIPRSKLHLAKPSPLQIPSSYRSISTTPTHSPTTPLPFASQLAHQLSHASVVAPQRQFWSRLKLLSMGNIKAPLVSEESGGRQLEINAVLKEHLDPVYLNIEDVSGGCGAFFKVTIVSDKFQGKLTLHRHRMVQNLIKDVIAQMHGITLLTYTPQQWEEMVSKETAQDNATKKDAV